MLNHQRPRAPALPAPPRANRVLSAEELANWAPWLGMDVAPNGKHTGHDGERHHLLLFSSYSVRMADEEVSPVLPHPKGMSMMPTEADLAQKIADDCRFMRGEIAETLERLFDEIRAGVVPAGAS
jgi:hypothetical protein